MKAGTRGSSEASRGFLEYKSGAVGEGWDGQLRQRIVLHDIRKQGRQWCIRASIMNVNFVIGLLSAQTVNVGCMYLSKERIRLVVLYQA